MKKRIISFILAFSLCSTFFVLPASALSVFDFSPGINVYLNWDVFFEGTGSENYSDHIATSYWARSHYVEYTYQSLSDWCLQNNLNQNDTGYYYSLEPLTGTTFYGIRILYKSGTFGGGRGSAFGGPRVHDSYNSSVIAWLCDNSGNAVVASYDPQVPDTVVVNDTAIDRIRNSRYHLISYDSYLDKLNDPLTIGNTTYYWYTRNDNGLNYLVDRSYHWIRCDPSGIPYVYVDATANTVNNTIRETTEVFNEAGEKLEDAVVNVGAALTSAITDLSSSVDNLTLNLPVGDPELIADCYYDSFNNSYEYYTYDTTNNTYNSYAFEYYTNYTYVYYLGETTEFEEYKCYYELPDGRSSADLTKEELEQLSYSVDVCNYVKVSDDNRLRALYHFDGNLDDSSYWSYANSVSWNNYDASITYNDVGTFGGALYLPNDVPYTLSFQLSDESCPDLTGDWTVEFRLYAGSNGSDTSLETFSCSAFGHDYFTLLGDRLSLGGSSTYPYANGVWNHVAIVSKSGVCSIYFNGVLTGYSTISSSLLTNSVTFTTAESAAFHMIDELRISDYAVYTEQFAPSTVPFDTNLVLVTPEVSVSSSSDEVQVSSLSSVPLAASLEPLSATASVVADDDGLVLVPQVLSASALSPFSSTFTLYCPDAPDVYFDVQLFAEYRPSATYKPVPDDTYGDWVLTNGLGVFSLKHGQSVVFSYSPVTQNDSLIKRRLTYSLAEDYSSDYSISYSNCSSHTISTDTGDSASITLTPLAPVVNTGSLEVVDSRSGDDYPSQAFTYTVTFSDTSLTGTYGDLNLESGVGSFARAFSGSFNVTGVPAGVSYTVSCSSADNWSVTSTGASGTIVADAVQTASFSLVYTAPVTPDPDPEPEPEPTPDPSGEGDITYAGKPILAVKSDIPVTNYQLGGVRPTYPTRGMVYALIESGYIISLQIYTGYAWESVDGRIFTGSRWVPYSYFNMITLSDMYDIVDASGNAGYEYIYTESGFWDWWQRQWLDFKAWYSSLSFGGSTMITEETTTNIENSEYNEYSDNVTVYEVVTDSGKSVWDIISGIFDIVGNVFKETPEAMDGLKSAFEAPDLESEDPASSAWYVFDAPYEFMSPYEEGG